MCRLWRLLAIWLLLLAVVTVVMADPKVRGRSQWQKSVRAGEEEFHKDRRRLYKKMKAKSSYSTVPLVYKEDASYWRRDAQEALLEQLKVTPQVRKAKNVIMFLGDGMSIATVTAARILKGQQTGKWEREKLNWDSFPYSAYSRTYTTDSQVADSASSATAYLCGVKSNLGTIGVDINVNKENCTAQQDTSFHTPSILQWFQEDDRSTGIVTTMRVTHATPAGSYAHIADREWEDDSEIIGDGEDDKACDDIAEQLIYSSPGKNFKVIMGGGRRGLFPKEQYDVEENHHGRRRDGKDLIKIWKEDKISKGATPAYVWNRDDLLNLDFDNTDYLMGLFAWSHMDYLVERDHEMDPSLPEMTRAALKVLQKDKKGYFLLVEGGLIDHGHHGNKAIKALTETVEMDAAVGVALDMTDPRDTLILVTGDHSHSMTLNGYPSRHNDILGIGDYSNEDYMAFTTVLYGNGPGYYISNNHRPDPSHESLHDVDYRQTSAVPMSSAAHSGDDVGIWAYGPHAHLFTGVHEQNYIAHALAYASCVGEGLTFCGGNRLRRNHFSSRGLRRGWGWGRG